MEPTSLRDRDTRPTDGIAHISMGASSVIVCRASFDLISERPWTRMPHPADAAPPLCRAVTLDQPDSRVVLP